MNWLKYFMQLNNRIKRIKAILDLLNQGLNLSTPNLVERFGVSKKIIQTDFKEYILPLFPNETIYYDYSLKTYKAKNNFLSKTLFNSKVWFSFSKSRISPIIETISRFKSSK